MVRTHVIYVITGNGKGMMQRQNVQAAVDRDSGPFRRWLQRPFSSDPKWLLDTARFFSMHYDLLSNDRDCFFFFVVATELFRYHVIEEMLFCEGAEVVWMIFWRWKGNEIADGRRNAGDKASIAATSRDTKMDLPGQHQPQQ